MFSRSRAEPLGHGHGLLVDQICQFEQEVLARDVVQPEDDHQIVAAALGRPPGSAVWDLPDHAAVAVAVP